MAQIIQVLALSQLDDIDPKTRDIYSRFAEGSIASLLDLLLEGPYEDLTEQTQHSATQHGAGPARSAVMLTSADMRDLVRCVT